MSKLVKNRPVLSTNVPLDDTQPSASFSEFDPRQYLNQYRLKRRQRQAGLLEEANAELQDPEGTLHDPVKDNDRLTALGALLIANFD